MTNSSKFKKGLAYVIPVLILVLFLLILTSSSYIKSNHETSIKIPSTIKQVQLWVTNQSWEEAELAANLLDSQWETIAPLMQIGTAEEDIRQLTQSISRLKGYIKGKEVGAALAEIEFIKFIWNHLGN